MGVREIGQTRLVSGFWKKASLHTCIGEKKDVSANQNGAVGGKWEWKKWRWQEVGD
jgi:hypothetical protein